MINQISAMKGNYTPAKRPADVNIHYIVIHATELSYGETIARFQEPHQVSAHVVLRQSDGLRTQMVAPHDVAWHAGNWDLNCRSLGIEQEAFVAQPESFTPAMMSALVAQIQAWATCYHIPLDRAHILGHDNVPAPTRAASLQMHQDPGWYFDWADLFSRLGVLPPAEEPIEVGRAVQITAGYADLHTQPEVTSHLIDSDSAVALPSLYHRVSFGQQFVCVQVRGDWVGIDFNGQLAWLNNLQQKAAIGVLAEIYTVKQDTTLLGSTQPHAEPIATLHQGEQYVIIDQLTGIETDEVNDQLQVQQTNQHFNQIWYNHRIGYIKVN
ncbi:N-acetylmuramoyl-L-alanine amidase [Secundilactobacillus folii]|uniref:N-acetylmuramoyl-L-alanine amidase n=1 Tax=Secundilactobacillus folii TaxID=2678357 RepID=A0A7X3C1J1_9LACO|nr:N-acetylmuramoyl-L-alanine amidase [Secundilactobacillus folii]MTV81780.1 hypothetical protein [Secundilactobacillus folii]